ncbi:TPA: ATP-grasp domain-containing protein [Salmonella enterica subsp. houtenae serovar 47:z36:-]|nr:ATP-grasp domain-containing protein [Salmonella enterica]HCM1977426.1 ATP-grasp domain-containing protein [Salmonella enterica subsp. houtenae serovar 47:z36:-]
MKKQAIIFVDVDETEQTRYRYREPHFLAARRQGLYCLTIARTGRQYPERLYADSDQVFFLDKLNESTITALLLEIRQDYQLNALFCYTGQATRNGQIGVIIAHVCQAMGLRYASPRGISACNNKFTMRQQLANHGIPSVPYALCHNETQLIEKGKEIGYPLIAKPPFGAGSAFIKKCLTEQELVNHYAIYQREYYHSLSADFFGSDSSDNDVLNVPGATILLEAWIDGTEGSVECVITEEAIYPLIINEKLILTERANTVLENLLITPPVSFSLTEQQVIRDYACCCLKAVGLNNAIAHFEFRMTPDGPIAIEINPRIGGLYVSAAFVDIAGFNPWELYLDLLTGKENIDRCLDQATSRVNNCLESYSMMALYPDKKGIFKGFADLSFVEHHPDILEFDQFPSGSPVSPDIEEYYLLKCWARVKNAADAKSLYQKISEQIKPVIE